MKRVAGLCVVDSHAERVVFPEVIRRLREAGVESYHVDFGRREVVFYEPEGGAAVFESDLAVADVAQEFVKEGVWAAVRASQAGEIKYREFCRRIWAAGCNRYWVFVRGGRVLYLGRSGEGHEERFPVI